MQLFPASKIDFLNYIDYSSTTIYRHLWAAGRLQGLRVAAHICVHNSQESP